MEHYWQELNLVSLGCFEILNLREAESSMADLLKYMYLQIITDKTTRFEKKYLLVFCLQLFLYSKTIFFFSWLRFSNTSA